MEDKDFDSALAESDNTQRLGTTKSGYKVNRSTYDGTVSRNSQSRGATETEFMPGQSQMQAGYDFEIDPNALPVAPMA